jgi:hypothetical protein
MIKLIDVVLRVVAFVLDRKDKKQAKKCETKKEQSNYDEEVYNSIINDIEFLRIKLQDTKPQSKDSSSS